MHTHTNTQEVESHPFMVPQKLTVEATGTLNHMCIYCMKWGVICYCNDVGNFGTEAIKGSREGYYFQYREEKQQDCV